MSLAVLLTPLNGLLDHLQKNRIHKEEQSAVDEGKRHDALEALSLAPDNHAHVYRGATRWRRPQKATGIVEFMDDSSYQVTSRFRGRATLDIGEGQILVRSTGAAQRIGG